MLIMLGQRAAKRVPPPDRLPGRTCGLVFVKDTGEFRVFEDSDDETDYLFDSEMDLKLQARVWRLEKLFDRGIMEAKSFGAAQLFFEDGRVLFLTQLPKETLKWPGEESNNGRQALPALRRF